MRGGTRNLFPDLSGITGILLAAGSARRFGSNKLLHPLLTGVPIAVTAARRLLAVLPRCVAVVRRWSATDGNRVACPFTRPVAVWYTH